MRPGRFAAAALAAGGAGAVMVVLMGNGAFAAAFSASDASIKVSGENVIGTGLSISPSDEAQAVVTLREVSLTNLCQSVLLTTPAGVATLVIRAKSPDRPHIIKNFSLGAGQLTGDAVLGGLGLGVEAAGPRGSEYGLRAGTLRMAKLRAVGRDLTAGSLTLEGLDISVRLGRHECF